GGPFGYHRRELGQQARLKSREGFAGAAGICAVSCGDRLAARLGRLLDAAHVRLSTSAGGASGTAGGPMACLAARRARCNRTRAGAFRLPSAAAGAFAARASVATRSTAAPACPLRPPPHPDARRAAAPAAL